MNKVSTTTEMEAQGYQDVFKYFTIILGLLSACALYYLPTYHIAPKHRQSFGKWLINEMIRMKFLLVKYVLEDVLHFQHDVLTFLDKCFVIYSMVVMIVLLCSLLDESEIIESFVNTHLVYVFILVNLLLGPTLQTLLVEDFDRVVIFAFINLVMVVGCLTLVTCCGSRMMDEVYLVSVTVVICWFIYFLVKCSESDNRYLVYVVNLVPFVAVFAVHHYKKYRK